MDVYRLIDWRGTSKQMVHVVVLVQLSLSRENRICHLLWNASVVGPVSRQCWTWLEIALGWVRRAPTEVFLNLFQCNFLAQYAVLDWLCKNHVIRIWINFLMNELIWALKLSLWSCLLLCTAKWPSFHVFINIKNINNLQSLEKGICVLFTRAKLNRTNYVQQRFQNKRRHSRVFFISLYFFQVNFVISIIGFLLVFFFITRFFCNHTQIHYKKK